MFLQIHTLTSYHASLLNRDDAGLAKRIPFGNATRLRVSSQCLKRHWRERLHETLPLPGGLRTRHFFERVIVQRLVEQEGVPLDQAQALTLALVELLLQKSAKADKAAKAEKGKKGKKAKAEVEQPEMDFGEEGESVDSTETAGLLVKQPILFGQPEADFLVALLKECAAAGPDAEKHLQERLKKDKDNFKAMLVQAGHGHLYAGLEGALFGRFVTSDILSRSDACVHVAHALTVHPLDTEVDYFTVVDDLNRDDETGAAHAGDMELGAGLFYGYVAVDVPGLQSNLTGCDRKDWKAQEIQEARQVLQGLVRTIAEVTPGAKLGSTAPYARADFVLLEAGPQQPRSLANAYLQALKLRDDGMAQAGIALKQYLDAQEQMYGTTAAFRAVATTKAIDLGSIPVLSLADATEQALAALFE
ncbi:MAG: type I-E CRISPR-associated protein Cas7/Cse4/CasC [Phycisphaerales bacterium]|nr:type I-E CRISPR-associated protein Cas7/Cse4/CasC [Phycisphaerales bacterium]